MISPTTHAALFGGTGTAAATPKKSLDKDAFLTLLVTQLKNQDPMDPADSSQMAAQLAQFTTVEQLTQLNDAVASQELSLQESALLSKTSLSAALIGRTVIAAGNQVTIPSAGSARICLDVGTGGGQATLRLLDASGNEVTTRELGTIAGGRQVVTLPADLPPGDYHYQVTVTGSGDTGVSVTHYTMGAVDGVSFKNGQIVLRIGTLDVAMDDLAEIEPAVARAAQGGGA